jgi:NAD(P)-dependent dehydrogenase (short-subunit alcohol dehydrogenase family)
MKGTDVGEVVVVLGAGSIGQAIARRVSAGRHVLLADLRLDNADAAAVVLSDAGFDTSTTSVDVSKRESVLALVEKATSLGDVTGLIHAAQTYRWRPKLGMSGRQVGNCVDLKPEPLAAKRRSSSIAQLAASAETGGRSARRGRSKVAFEADVVRHDEREPGTSSPPASRSGLTRTTRAGGCRLPWSLGWTWRRPS